MDPDPYQNEPYPQSLVKTRINLAMGIGYEEKEQITNFKYKKKLVFLSVIIYTERTVH